MLFELREQSAPRGIGKGGKCAVERCLLILNHMVKYRGNRLGCQSRIRGGNGVAAVFQENCQGPARKNDLSQAVSAQPKAEGGVPRGAGSLVSGQQQGSRFFG